MITTTYNDAYVTGNSANNSITQFYNKNQACIINGGSFNFIYSGHNYAKVTGYSAYHSTSIVENYNQYSIIGGGFNNAVHAVDVASQMYGTYANDKN